MTDQPKVTAESPRREHAFMRFALEKAVELFEMDDECGEVGSECWCWLQQARIALEGAASSGVSAARLSEAEATCTNAIRNCVVALKLLEDEQDKVSALTASLQQLRTMALDWRAQAELTRLGKGQRTREKAGHEVLANCAYALDDVLKTLEGNSPEGEK